MKEEEEEKGEAEGTEEGQVIREEGRRIPGGISGGGRGGRTTKIGGRSFEKLGKWIKKGVAILPVV